jgi:hypothetical protein
MGTDALQHRESIGRFYYLARTVKNSKRLTLLEFIDIQFFLNFCLPFMVCEREQYRLGVQSISRSPMSDSPLKDLRE